MVMLIHRHNLKINKLSSIQIKYLKKFQMSTLFIDPLMVLISYPIN